MISNKTIFYSLKNENAQRHIGQYFQIIYFNNKYHLYYNSEDRLKLVVSDDLCFLNKKPIVVIRNAPGGCFCIVNHNSKLYMLCGAHQSNEEKEEIEIPDLVWPQETKTRLDWTVKREDRKNGMYLLDSEDGINWREAHKTPVLHAFVSSDSCVLGEVCFDVSPYLIKNNDQFYYYGRLNSSLDERRIYVRTSKNLIDWTDPERIKVINENNNNLKKNYYLPVVFKKEQSLYFYMILPYFECCGTEKRECQSGQTLLLRSQDGFSWEIINSCLSHEGKYKHRINDVLVKDKQVYAFFRENFLECHQNLVHYNLNTG